MAGIPLPKMKATDTYRHQGMRRNLVKHLETRGIIDAQVLQAISEVPRHLFMGDSAFDEKAYQDIAFPIGSGQTISQPFTVAFQSSLLHLKPGMKVLEIGTGSGYQCAVLCAMGVKVFSIERQRALYMRTRSLMGDLGYKASLYYGDGYKGQPAHQPFDRVIVTCGAPDIPDVLLQQMKPGGRCVIPVGEGQVQTMITIDRGMDGEMKRAEHGDFSFVPMLSERSG